MTKKIEDYHRLPGFERKEFPTFVKTYDEDQGIVDHFIAIMGNVDNVSDRIMSGAFQKTIKENKERIRVLDQHMTDSVTRIVGKPTDLKEVGRDELTPDVLKYAPDATGGLLATTQYAIETSRGRDVFKLIKGGFAPESSIGYDATRTAIVEEKDDDGNERTIRELKEIRLWEYSNVIFGANEATTVVSAKADPSPSEAKPAPEETENTIRIRVRDPGDFQEGSFRTIPIGGDDSGIQATVGKLDDQNTMTVQSYIFDKEKFTIEEAQVWVDEHKKDALPELDEKQENEGPYQCECLECGHKMESEEHCRDVKCPECDGEMRRAERPGDGKEQAKAVNLSEQVETIRSAFHNQYNSPNGPWDYWVNTIYDEYIIVQYEGRDGNEWYQVTYTVTDDKVEFAPRGEWVEGDYIFTPKGEKTDRMKAMLEEFMAEAKGILDPGDKAGRVLAQRNAARIGAALRSLIDVLEDAGIDIPGFGREPEPEEEEKSIDPNELEVLIAETEIALLEL